ncbi:MAG: U32 family peptidase [Gammaproteobacteria bacterium]|nr:U32 family peptidase [Gammaproteobacteria bacterium]NIR97619.1 U32 family peptidase [Gammaproteobacteria bacterium]NIT63269.1 U32 family peptidase [Gammaproteobacteria bacterium]NIV20201.1 U32 family peptidase [Gammaproteobacteria bacterium]NIY31849.1 U32 family peptidase [Gammaproteobacteria bacterium]
MELVCPAGNLRSLKSAVDNGADAVYIGFRDDTNARRFAGLNFNPDAVRSALAYAHGHGTRVFLAVNTYPQPAGWNRWREAVDRAVELGLDTLIAADLGVLDYAARHWPDLALHLSVQGSATNDEAIRFYHEHFGIRRVVLPRVLSLRQVESLAERSPVPLEVFGFGSLCVMVEGRCLLSSFATGQSPNTCGACSPAWAVEWNDTGGALETRLGGILIDRFAEGENAGYPTLCKGRFQVGGHTYYAIEEPTSLNTLDVLPQLQAAGVAAIKIEGRQRSPAYVAQVTRVWREALDSCRDDPEGYAPRPEWSERLRNVSEGTQTTLGAYHRPWQ